MPRPAKRKNIEEILENASNDEPDVPPPPKRITKLQLSVPERLIKVGSVYVCGQGDLGQLGLGEEESKMESKKLTLLEKPSNVVDIRAGGVHTLLLTEDGKVYSFGCNDEGALGRSSTEEGSEFEPKLIELPGRSVKLSAGDSHSACLLEDGSVYAWGSFRSSHGNMGFSIKGNERLPIQILPNTCCSDIASGADHLIILTCSGRVYSMGCGEQGQLGRVSLRSASGVGRRGRTELLQPTEIFFKRCKPIEKIWATNYCTFARESVTGNILACGLNNYKQLGLIKVNDYTINNPSMSSFTDVKEIAGGQHHTLVLKNDGSVYVIGRKDYGRLGLSDLSEDVKELQKVVSLNSIKIESISGGEAQSFAVTEDGETYAWGMGSSYQLGTNSESDANLPTLLSTKTLGRVLKASSGGQHSIFLIDKTGLVTSKVANLTTSRLKNREKTDTETTATPGSTDNSKERFSRKTSKTDYVNSNTKKVSN